MKSKYVMSWAMVSLFACVGVRAELVSVSEESAVLKEEVASLEKTEVVSAEMATSDELQEAPKKIKPHFAGARRAPDIQKVSDTTKPKKVKNPWFFSKTQPKVEKKDDAYEPVTQLPEEHPYFVKTRDVASVQGEKTALPKKEVVYPKTGVDAPKGHVYFTGEWLFFRTRNVGWEFATNHFIDFNYFSGYRVGLGVHLPYTDGWDIYAKYTDFRQEVTKTAAGPFFPLFLYQENDPPITVVAGANTYGAVSFRAADLSFGRAFYLSRSLSVHPIVGMKGAWIRQGGHFHYVGGELAAGDVRSVFLRDEYRGAGPLFGADARWHWGAGFSLQGAASSSIVMGYHRTIHVQHQLGVPVINDHCRFNLASPMVQMAVAVAWDRNFNKERAHAGLQVGFDSQYWWDQNQTEFFTGSTLPVYQRQRGDLALYGLTVGARFDF